MTQIVCLVILLAAGGALWFSSRRAEWRRQRRLRSRDLDSAEWRSFAKSRDVADEAIDIVLLSAARALGIEPVKLTPSDRFGVELAPERGWELDDSLAEIEWDLRGLGIVDLRAARTLGDLVVLVDRHLRAAPSRHGSP